MAERVVAQFQAEGLLEHHSKQLERPALRAGAKALNWEAVPLPHPPNAHSTSPPPLLHLSSTSPPPLLLLSLQILEPARPSPLQLIFDAKYVS